MRRAGWGGPAGPPARGCTGPLGNRAAKGNRGVAVQGRLPAPTTRTTAAEPDALGAARSEAKPGARPRDSPSPRGRSAASGQLRAAGRGPGRLRPSPITPARRPGRPSPAAPPRRPTLGNLLGQREGRDEGSGMGERQESVGARGSGRLLERPPPRWSAPRLAPGPPRCRRRAGQVGAACVAAPGAGPGRGAPPPPPPFLPLQPPRSPTPHPSPPPAPTVQATLPALGVGGSGCSAAESVYGPVHLAVRSARARPVGAGGRGGRALPGGEFLLSLEVPASGASPRLLLSRVPLNGIFVPDLFFILRRICK